MVTDLQDLGPCLFFFLWKAIIKSNFEILGLKTSRNLAEEIFMFCIFFQKGQVLIFTVESERECDVGSLGETVFFFMEKFFRRITALVSVQL